MVLGAVGLAGRERGRSTGHEGDRPERREWGRGGARGRDAAEPGAGSGGVDGAVMGTQLSGGRVQGAVPAPLRARALAAGADFIVVTGMGLVLEEALRVILVEGVGLGAPPGLYPASMFVGGWVYFVVLETRFGGRTIGKMGTGLGVAGEADALWLSVRYVAKVLQLLVGRGLLFGVVLFDERQRALHDHVARTVVVVDSDPLSWRLPRA